jgi:hypothetical protein
MRQALKSFSRPPERISINNPKSLVCARELSELAAGMLLKVVQNRSLEELALHLCCRELAKVKLASTNFPCLEDSQKGISAITPERWECRGVVSLYPCC